ncbi:hypothetical protein NLJ89_g10906 [Agrocybe chaxingu]|uniref:DNAJ-containing protein X-domain domain-containing protein n=1 Tax=Agrocybe chaxingu TaxID=84603 RepID=A0A9W8JQ91_9AGAR|nr:hypothetical protein NLJ89_g10906 [Agrocybe chaxingu]
MSTQKKSSGRLKKLVDNLECKLGIFTESATGLNDPDVSSSWQTICQLEADELKRESYSVELLQMIGFAYVSKAKHHPAKNQSFLGVGGWLHNVQGKYHIFSETVSTLRAAIKLKLRRSGRALLIIWDHIRQTPLANLQATLTADLSHIWDSLSKPSELKDCQLSNYFNLTFTALPLKTHRLAIIQCCPCCLGHREITQKSRARCSARLLVSKVFVSAVPLSALCTTLSPRIPTPYLEVRWTLP